MSPNAVSFSQRRHLLPLHNPDDEDIRAFSTTLTSRLEDSDDDHLSIWSCLCNDVVGEITGPNSVPVAALDEARHFNNLCAFVKTRKDVNEDHKYVFIGNLHNIISKEKTDISEWKNMINVDGDFEPIVSCYQYKARGLVNSTDSEVAIQVLNVHDWKSRLTTSNHKALCIQRDLPGIENAQDVFIITRAWTAGRIIIEYYRHGEEYSRRTWDLCGPIPIAFRISRVSIDKDGRMSCCKEMKNLPKGSWEFHVSSLDLSDTVPFLETRRNRNRRKNLVQMPCGMELRNNSFDANLPSKRFLVFEIICQTFETNLIRENALKKFLDYLRQHKSPLWQFWAWFMLNKLSFKWGRHLEISVK